MWKLLSIWHLSSVAGGLASPRVAGIKSMRGNTFMGMEPMDCEYIVQHDRAVFKMHWALCILHR